MFLRFALFAGGIWKRDILVADIAEPEISDASEIDARGLTAKEVVTPKDGENVIPARRWNSQIVWKRSGFPKIHLNTGSTRKRRRVRRWSSRRIGRVSTIRFGRSKGITLFVMTLNQQLNAVCQKEESFPKPLRLIDVVRRINTRLDVLMESRM